MRDTKRWLQPPRERHYGKGTFNHERSRFLSDPSDRRAAPQAQAARGMMEALFPKLAEYGLLALILAIVMYAYWKKDGELIQSYKDRIADNTAMIKAIEATNTTYRALEATSENRTRVIDATAEATKGTADAVKAQAEILNEVRRGVERNSAEIAILSRDRIGPRRRDSGS